ncbi:DUF4124 domain-containing protein [Halioglobus sp. HI00S01]|uniref:DUF4124 domain-containing protein n=1 Tax=Halioglobus sp. HI00S01 TaxID=1822214 RepID=UPI0012E7A558|nr:DUF4124 domain-containing protein [Halioglobus sp. HI00S01]
MKRSALTLMILALASAQAWSQIYKTVDENGNVSFTDTPPPDSNTEQVQLQQTNSTAPPPDIPAYGTSATAADTGADESAVPVARITAPEQETTIPMGPGNFSVSATVSPALSKGQAMQLLMDGEPQGEPQAAGFWDLTNTFRGAHDLEVTVVSPDGETLSTSEPLRVYVMRPSIN